MPGQTVRILLNQCEAREPGDAEVRYLHVPALLNTVLQVDMVRGSATTLSISEDGTAHLYQGRATLV